MTSQLRVAVLFGGRSGEHQVSLMSARSLLAAIDRQRFQVVPIAITQQGRWLLADDLHWLWSQDPPPPVDDSRGRPLVLVPGPEGRRPLLLAEGGHGPRWLEPIDVAFPMLHGPHGEDGTVQGLLELAGIPYVGAGVAASAAGMDKVMMKELFRARGLPVVPFVAVTVRHWRQDPHSVLAQVEQSLGYPCFTKPATLGSSVGIRKCHNREELRQGLEEAARYGRKVVVERAVDARELEISLLGNEQPAASVAGEIRPRDRFYTYWAKYTPGGSELVVPASIPQRVLQEMQRLAIAAFHAIDAAGMARVDFFLERSTGRLFVNEINTIPGFTALSMYPRLWEASGLTYTDLITRLIQLALERHEEQKSLRVSYDGES